MIALLYSDVQTAPTLNIFHIFKELERVTVFCMTKISLSLFVVHIAQREILNSNRALAINVHSGLIKESI